ncbi:hypothetical protein XAP412_550003 [Xanthomonas phaseoli pv. phaseoli]|uniref:Uncharacterized protein n=1 Tax=Xanthomonas campestris pv. phaseoli TaxID=317013 RepID=A0AB38E346_XANCH|nr:hypothetical protein XAP6984_600003 [Xanthomonas phaseoli pv. phaseoli]SON87750.1 hypothetical protein XAP412_550003 [Xanthomonas phaseoli pv. phaseoli]SON91411.1 hypothetical protein XAP7430_560003 [Xanthomonas phaseoli pv. phaseoli]SOO28645.1 hypothetical protein XAP6164_2600002 [Xanthomonas phaseoli pv. phaseoli]
MGWLAAFERFGRARDAGQWHWFDRRPVGRCPSSAVALAVALVVALAPAPAVHQSGRNRGRIRRYWTENAARFAQ